MKKALVTFGFLLATVLVSALCFAAWRPVHPVVQAPEPVAVHESRPVVFEQGAVLVLVQEKKEAPKARPVAKKAKVWSCDEGQPVLLGPKTRAANAGSVVTCGWK